MPITDKVQTKDFVIPSFHDFWRSYRNPQYTFFVCKGGRDSAKSTTIGQRLAYDIMRNPINAIVMRKVGDNLSQSVYEQIKKSLMFMQCDGYFEFGKSPLKIIYKPRGNGFFFRGGDDTRKIKSIVTADFPIARLWIEEADEFKTEDELKVVYDSILREQLPDEMRYKIILSYNPPKRKQHFLNKKYESQNIPSNTYIHHSCYLDNPFLSEQSLEEINNTKATNERKYKWMYLGEPSGGGVVPFDNLVFRTITAEETEHFDNIRQGLDFGYAVDPLAFVKVHYDKKNRKLYFIDEIYGVKMSNREFAQAFKSRGFSGEIIADSAEPKSIAELRTYGLRIIGAKKGDGSVEYGEEWLDDLAEIVIDPSRTPNAAREFENIDYCVDKDGNVKPKLEDKDNHTIDAVRYSCEYEMGKSAFALLSTKMTA